MSDDQELQNLRNKLFQVCPEMQNQILTMTKQDLLELLQLTGNTSLLEDKPAPKSAKAKSRSLMINQLLRMSPDITAEELKQLSDTDIEEIYFKYKEQFDLRRKKEEVKPESKKRKLVENGVINTYEMKRILIDKLPEYRNDIRNLPDDDIRKMYYQLQGKNQLHQPVSKERKLNQQPYYQNYGPIPMIDPSLQVYGTQSTSMKPVSVQRPIKQSSYENNESMYEGNMSNDFDRKRGRPRKNKEYVAGYGYDNIGSQDGQISIQQNGYDYMPDYSNMSYPASQAAYSTAKYDMQPQSSFQPQSNFQTSIFDQSNINQQYKPPKPSPPSGYDLQPTPVPMPAPVVPIALSSVPKNEKKQLSLGNRKCKITFYLDYSDLEDSEEEETGSNKIGNQNGKTDEESKNSNQKNCEDDRQGCGDERKKMENGKDKVEKRKKKLEKIIESMYQAFSSKKWVKQPQPQQQ